MFTKVVESKEEFKEWILNITPNINFNKPYLCVVKEFRKKRTLKQNDLYWCWITAIANYIGDDRKSVHEAYKRQFLPWVKIEMPGGLSYYSPGHTPDCDTQEFSKYMNEIHLHANHFLKYHLPYPGDEGFEEFMMTYRAIGKGMDF